MTHQICAEISLTITQSRAYSGGMNTARHIIDRIFGGTRSASRLLELPPSTIQSWKVAGHIPAWHQPDVLEKGQAAGYPISEADFIRRSAEVGDAAA